MKYPKTTIITTSITLIFLIAANISTLEMIKEIIHSGWATIWNIIILYGAYLILCLLSVFLLIFEAIIIEDF